MYSDSKIKRIYSCARIGDLAVIGGDDWNLRFLDLKKKEFVGDVVGTGVKEVLSLQFCALDSGKIVLSVSGNGAEYCSRERDLFDVTSFIMKVGVKVLCKDSRRNVRGIRKKSLN
jgi:hypothetical protein